MLTYLGWSTDSEVRRIPMPKDTPPSTTPHPRSQQREQPITRRQRTPPRPKKEKTPEPEVPNEGPSATIEEAFLRAGAPTIEVAPVIRDFQKEAVAFVPSVVKRRPLPPPKPSVNLEKVVPVVEKSFATTMEEVKDEEEESLVASVLPSVATPPAQALPEKRQREVEVETKSQQPPPPPLAPPKRRRLVNAAPDV